LTIRRTLATTWRLLLRLRPDLRTLTLLLVVPAVLVTVLRLAR
jgi:nitrate reductase beta subunit